MANRRAIKLFAVAVLATSSAVAQAGGGGSLKTNEPPKASPTSEPIVEVGAKDGKIDLTIKPVAVIKPRVLANYRPACGNVGGGKSAGPPDDCTAEQIRVAVEQNRLYAEDSNRQMARWSAERKALLSTAEAIIRAQPALKARVLINGRPACGNTLTKSPAPAFCRIEGPES